MSENNSYYDFEAEYARDHFSLDERQDTCRATGGGIRDHAESRPNPSGGRLNEKICTYNCDCKDEKITVTYSAGFSDVAECIGQVTPVFHYTQPADAQKPTREYFDFDTNSLLNRFTPLGPPNGFLDKIDEECEDC